LTIDESNGSQVEQVDLNIVGNEKPSCEAIKQLSIGDVGPVEAQEEDEEPLQASTPLEGPKVTGSIEEQTPEVPGNAAGSQPPGKSPEVPGSGSSAPQDTENQQEDHQGDAQASSSKPQADENDDDQPLHQPLGPSHPRVHQVIQWDHPVDNILGSTRRGVTTRSRLQNFCAFYSFVSSLEPIKVEQALEDPDWVVAMQEELNNFERNQVWELVERPKTNIIVTKWVFRNKQDEFGIVIRNKARLVAQGYTQVEGLDFGETNAPVERLEQFGSYSLSLPIMTSSYIKWISRVHFSMEHSPKKSMLSNHRVLKIPSVLIMCTNFVRRFMVSRKHQEHGMNALRISCLSKALR
jgi:hypothetical protein